MKTITKEEIINIANDVGAFKYTNRHMTDEPAFALWDVSSAIREVASAIRARG
jgi:hypothetical protein